MRKKTQGNPEEPGGPIRAFILCGGAGTRLRPVLDDRPKSMAPIMSVPFLHVLIERLRSQGVRDVILGTGYLAESIESYFGSGDKFAMHIRYSREPGPLGTAGALKLAEPLLGDPVLVLNGDSYAEWSLAPMLEMFAATDAAMVIMLQSVTDVRRYGSVTLDRNGRVIRFVEKAGSTGPGLVNAGAYLLRKQIVRDMPEGTAISLETDVFPRLLDRGVYGLVCTGPFIDIGIPEDLHRAQTLLASQARAASGNRSS
jgi:mannose-1-phosphate guanylyltransferase